MDSDLYRDVTDLADDSPTWVQHVAELWTEAGLLLFGALFVAAWWRRRRDEPRVFAIAVLAPVATAVAYVCSELLKTADVEDRLHAGPDHGFVVRQQDADQRTHSDSHLLSSSRAFPTAPALGTVSLATSLRAPSKHSLKCSTETKSSPVAR
jgi:hypothetical protein